MDAEAAANLAKQQGFTERLIAKVIANLQIVIRNVHIRYEDSETLPGHTFGAGVIIREFKAQSTVSRTISISIANPISSDHRMSNKLYFSSTEWVL